MNSHNCFLNHGMRKPFQIILLLLVAVSACTIYKDYPIDILTPPEIDLSNEIQNIAVLNANFKPLKDSSLYYYSDYEKVKISQDLQNLLQMKMIDSSLKSFSQTVSLNGRFNNIELIPYNFVPVHYGDSLLAFTPDFIQEICENYNVDAVIVLEILAFKYSEYGTVFRNTPEANEVSTLALWRIYNPNNTAFLDQKIMIDTVYWNVNDENIGNTGTPDMNMACVVAAEVAGINYAKRISSNWEKVNRMYIVPPLDDFRNAALNFQDGKWDEALRLWDKYSDKKFGKLAIHANYNMALAYEMKDDLDKAINCINKSFEQVVSLQSKKDLLMVNTYQMILIKRKNDLAKINMSDSIKDELLPIRF